MDENSQGRDKPFDPALAALMLFIIVLIFAVVQFTNKPVAASVSGLTSELGANADLTLDERLEGYDFSDCAQPG